jgi:hypothetical protein
MPDGNLKTKPCRLCGETIQRTAIKCKHCDGFQGRWFFLNLSIPTLGLLVALVSVISLSAPALVRLLTPDASAVKISFQHFQDGTAYFVATNAGNQPGSIGEVYMDDGTRSPPQRYYLRAEATKRVVPPGASQEMAFAIPCFREEVPQIQYAQDGGFGSRPMASDVRLDVIVIQFDGTQSTVVTKLSPLSGISAVNDRHVRCVLDELVPKKR